MGHPSRYGMSAKDWFEELLDMMAMAIGVLPRVKTGYSPAGRVSGAV
jgi:hypothetical protein